MATLSIWSNGNFKEISFDGPQPLHTLLEAAGFYGWVSAHRNTPICQRKDTYEHSSYINTGK